MCGRYYLLVKKENIMKKYGIIDNNINYSIRPEIFPSQKAPVIMNKNKKISTIKWGFSPSFTNKLIINARSETVAKKSIFKKSFSTQRCLIPASGFFEWKKENNKKIKYNIHIRNKDLFSFAGLYDKFREDGNSFLAFTILTTAASNKINDIHNRMPVILAKKHENLWLSKDFNDLSTLKNILQSSENNDFLIENTDQQLKFDF